MITQQLSSQACRREGVAALWTGLAPNIARNAIVNATELATYDSFKEMFLAAGMPDNIVTHIGSGLAAGFAAVCVGSPVDVVKSRMMGAKPGKYSNIVDCFVKTATQDGLLAFYKGFVPNFARLGSWNVVMFLTLEQVKKLAASYT
jgi:solute carrier family 25 (mitochondrial uncoupling protein), member 8/9